MPDYRVASRYAKSLLDLGIEKNLVDKFYEDMLSFSDSLKNRDLYLLVKSPIIKADKKISILREIFNSHFNKETMTFLEIITRKGREKFLPEIAESFVSQYKEYMHITEVTLTTAQPVDDDLVEKIKATLLRSDATDEKVEIKTIVDPELIGGFVIEMDDKLYDASVAHKLDEMRRELTQGNYIK